MRGRLFRQHEIRKELEVLPIWDFYSKGKDVRSMPVPCCWESNPKLVNYRGKARYETYLEGEGNIRILFKGVSHTAEVYLDDSFLGEHYGAYGAFDFVAKKMKSGQHKLRVEVDNSFHKNSALHIPNDYYTYGGITRPVIIQQLENVYIENVYITTKKILVDKKWQWKCSIRVIIKNLSDSLQEIELHTFLQDKLVAGTEPLERHRLNNQKVLLAAEEEKEVNFQEIFSDINEYSMEAPNLYYLKVCLFSQNIPMDDYIERFGFREIRVEENQILFNEKKLQLKGFNRHEDYAEFGCSIPLQAMYRDMELIKDMGANCVRTSHYPNDERWLDLCDENGILVWEESHARGLSEERMNHPKFMKQSMESIQEMVQQHYNHPSIFVWGLLNECASNTSFGRVCYEKLISEIRKLDQSRPVTFASCHIMSDICLDLVDIISFNIYPGWYFEETIGNHLKRLKNWIKKVSDVKKPLIISEIGAGAIYGYHNCSQEKWTEEFQSNLLEKQIKAILKDQECSGVILWQFADCRVDSSWFQSRPMGRNNKGIVDRYRREKLAYDKVKKLFCRESSV